MVILKINQKIHFSSTTFHPLTLSIAQMAKLELQSSVRLRKCGKAEADPEFLKRGGTLCQLPQLADEKNFRFQMVSKGQNNVRNYKFLAKYFYQYFQIFSAFIYDENLPMKSYQFFKTYKHFDKEREKSSSQEQKKLKKVVL